MQTNREMRRSSRSCRRLKIRCARRITTTRKLVCKSMLKVIRVSRGSFLRLAKQRVWRQWMRPTTNIQAERLNRALGQYRLAVQASSPESDKAILSRAHESMGRINAFLDNKKEAMKEFDEAIKIGDVTRRRISGSVGREEETGATVDRISNLRFRSRSFICC